jgi:glycine dehydrogenase
MTDHLSPDDLAADASFRDRHLGPGGDDLVAMLDAVGMDSLDALLDAAVPSTIRQNDPLDLPAALSERDALDRLRSMVGTNQVMTSLIGLGYHDTITPPVILRNLLENPGWYTAYTPYQPEISQGRLEAVLNFQTMVTDLTGMEIANASLLDEGTAVAEAMGMCARLHKGEGDVFVVDPDCHPQTKAVVATRARPLRITIVETDPTGPLPEGTIGAVVQYPGSSGQVTALEPAAEAAHAAGAKLVVAADLLALVSLRSPGEAGADIVVGTTQRFGVPLGFGGPHAAYLATRQAHQRSLPGRLVGVSVDEAGRTAYRLALQTREQHIRRERATSNICTAQVLLAVIAGMYACWHGPDGLARIAGRVHRLTTALVVGLRSGGIEVETDCWFDTVTVRVPGRADAVLAAALDRGINLRLVDDDRVALSLDETSTPAVVEAVWASFCVTATMAHADDPTASPLPHLLRSDEILTHPVFHQHRTETEMMRYLRCLADRDVALDRSMIPLGSCTMKLNAAAEMIPVTWPELGAIHPFAPIDQVSGYLQMIHELETWLVEITGYDAVSLQPNAGSQGEYAGLLAIAAYHADRGEPARDLCLIPSSAHGTNAASAAMAGMRVSVVACDEQGNIDLDDLRTQAAEHSDRLAACMITYPSTHGVFEEHVGDVCAVVHDHGGQVYLDGANLNALVGVARPGRFGADVSHLNLHKTFCIPHGGGGPGVGPVAVRSHLAPFLPNHPLVEEAGPATGVGPISAAPWGSAGILAISWMYIAMMGPGGMRDATATALLSANYLARALGDSFPVLYTGRDDLVAHECILDVRPITAETGVTVDDVAKRLMDYGFHAPTMSFPVAGTLMVEPTESESKAELDRFIEAMRGIRAEIGRVAAGEWAVEESPLRHAPHTAVDVAADDWSHPYGRELAAYPVPSLRLNKWFTPVSRIDGAYGDRNVMCSCPPLEAFSEA